MPEYLRVKAKDTGHKFSIIASAFDPDAQTELKQDAVDIAGRPLPPEYASPSSSTTTSNKGA